MELQDQLRKLVPWFVKGKLQGCSLFLHTQNYGFYSVVIVIEIENRIVRASATSRSKFGAFLKALAELGEELICDSLEFTSRSGIAGGIFRSNATIRGKAELVERDAFLFHYRNKVPFERIQPLGDNTDFIHFKLQSADQSMHTVLTCSKETANGQDKCLLFGTGTHPELSIAIEKALEEYLGVYLFHKATPELCESTYNNATVGHFKRKTDLHHASARDVRNIKLFENLCNSAVPNCSRESIDPNLWNILELQSPIRALKFVKLEHPKLQQMTFGKPEHDSGQAPLYHPFW